MNPEAAARARIERWRGWRSTPERPWPSHELPSPTRTELDDVAAVLAGSKPAAWACINSIRPRHRSELAALLRLARKQGLEISIERTRHGGQVADLLVGFPENVKGLRELVAKDPWNTPGWDGKLTRLLGYHPKAIERCERELTQDKVAMFRAERAEREAARGEWWSKLPRYKKLGYVLRSRLGYPADLLNEFRFSRTLKTIDHVLREPMPPEKLNRASTPDSAPRTPANETARQRHTRGA